MNDTMSKCCGAGVVNDEGDDDLGQCIECGEWCEVIKIVIDDRPMKISNPIPKEKLIKTLFGIKWGK